MNDAAGSPPGSRGLNPCGWKAEHVTARTSTETARDIPEATVARLPVYLRALVTLADSGTTTCSSEELARAAGVNSAKLRKDLSYLGSYGTRGVGYDVDYLRYQIAREIGVTQDWPVVIVGIGNLGHALANYSGFRSRGLPRGRAARRRPRPAGRGRRRRRRHAPSTTSRRSSASRASPSASSRPRPLAAQAVADRMVAAGVTSILNFAPAVLDVPDGVDVRKVDLSIELQILAYHEQRKSGVHLAATRSPAASRADGSTPHERPRRGHLPQLRPGLAARAGRARRRRRRPS